MNNIIALSGWQLVFALYLGFITSEIIKLLLVVVVIVVVVVVIVVARFPKLSML